MVEIKFCGLTRPEDAAHAAALGASYAGVIFAGGPRRVSPDRASAILAGLPSSVRRVGVFAEQSAGEIAEIASTVALDAVQLHGDPSAARVEELRAVYDGHVWAVVRSADGALPPGVQELLDVTDAVVLDALVPGKLGGSGVALPWRAIATALGALRRGRRLVLAGGLRAENVGEAIACLAPEVVDVSSGVESTPGIKDHARMRAFRDAVHATTVKR